MARTRTERTDRTIEPRKRPQQERSHGLVERILAAAQALMGEVGLKGLTTIAIAERAGLSVGSLYQYFPNKEAIIVELARRWLARFRAMLAEQRRRPKAHGWEEFRRDLTSFMQAVAQVYRENESLLPVLVVMAANPELSRIDLEHDEAILGALADWFVDTNPDLDRKVAHRLALVMLEAGHACLVAAVGLDRPTGDLLRADLETMMLALLRPHLERA